MPPRPQDLLKLPVASWSDHFHKWKGCTACSLCTKRKKVVLGRGSIPCDVILVGEAPGQAEEVFGKPFWGPAGNKLQAIIDLAIDTAEINRRPNLFFTNTVACFPKGVTGKAHEPPEEAVKACQPRLQEIVELSEAKAIVMVGKVAQKSCPKLIDYDFEYSSNIIHPSALLQADPAIGPEMTRRCVAILRDLFETMGL